MDIAFKYPLHFCALVINKTDPLFNSTIYKNYWHAYVRYTKLLCENNCRDGEQLCVVADYMNRPSDSNVFFEQEVSRIPSVYNALRAHHMENFQAIRASAGKLPLPNDSLDALFTFNAIHHFRLSPFLNETARILKKGGYAFMYTRLRSQNRRNVWGKYFPLFHQKETRLYTLNALRAAVQRVPSLRVESIEMFSYKRASTLRRLIEQAKGKHYSTFSLYTSRAFQHSLEKFEQNILRHFVDEENITWIDENTLLVLRSA